RKDALDGAIINKLVYCAIHVFNALVHDRRGHITISKSLRCFVDEFLCRNWFECFIQEPSENAEREVVDNQTHGVS
ncbi:MAG: hypothetical protein ACK5OC_00805, partial [Pirellula sp.]